MRKTGKGPRDFFRGKHLITGLVLGGCLLASGCRQTSDDGVTKEVVRPVKSMTVGVSLAGRTQRMSGEVRAAERADLAFQVSGTLLELPVKEGQRVRKGDLLARLDPRDYETNLRNALGVLGKAKAKLEYDIAEYRRYVKVKQTEPGAVSDSMVALKLAAENVSRADVQSAEATVAAARDQLAYSYLKAPFDGVIARRFVDNFQEIKAKETILSLQNVSEVEVLLDVPELMVAPLRKTLPEFHAEFAADPGRHFQLSIKEFATEADPLTQTYRMVLVMPAPKGIRVLPGMTATVIIEFPNEVASSADIVIPAIAVFADDAGKPHVWVIDPKANRVTSRAVTTGDLSGSDSVWVRRGLSAGEKIAISGVSKLREGQTVRPLERPSNGGDIR